MKRILALGLFLLLSSAALMAAKSTQTFTLPAKVQVGSVVLPEGPCEVTWGEPTGSQIQLTIKASDRKIYTVTAHAVEAKSDSAGAKTSLVNGVNILRDLHTRKIRFEFQETPAESK